MRQTGACASFKAVDVTPLPELAGLDSSLLRSVLANLLELEPAAIAVLATGSYAKGSAMADSDLDLTAITRVPAAVRYRTWFEERAPERPLHVSVAAKSVEQWLAGRAEPARWALGFPAIDVALFLWAVAEARDVLGEPPSVVHPPAPPELEDFIEAATKVKRAAGASDWLGLRWHAQRAAALAPGLLRELSPERLVRDRREAIQAAADLPVVPEHYRVDLLVSLGLTTANDEQVREAAMRLASEVLAFLRERNPDVDGQPEIARYLTDGTLERYLAF